MHPRHQDWLSHAIGHQHCTSSHIAWPRSPADRSSGVQTYIEGNLLFGRNSLNARQFRRDENEMHWQVISSVGKLELVATSSSLILNAKSVVRKIDTVDFYDTGVGMLPILPPGHVFWRHNIVLHSMRYTRDQSPLSHFVLGMVGGLPLVLARLIDVRAGVYADLPRRLRRSTPAYLHSRRGLTPVVLPL